MNKIRLIWIISLISAAGFLFQCKPKAENELKYWDNHKKDMAEAKEKYPNVAKALDQRFAAAEKIYNEAMALTNIDEKAKKLKEANEKLDELVGQFSQIKYKTEDIEKTLKKLNDLKLTEPGHSARNRAYSSIASGLREAAGSISTAVVQTEEDALKVTKEVISKLISLKGDADRAVKAAQPPKESSTTKKKK